MPFLQALRCIRNVPRRFLCAAVLTVAAAGGAAAQVPSALLPHDLSPLGMFRQADIVVRAVMTGLAFASVVTWTILVVKLAELALATAAARRGAAGQRATSSKKRSGNVTPSSVSQRRRHTSGSVSGNGWRLNTAHKSVHSRGTVR